LQLRTWIARRPFRSTFFYVLFSLLLSSGSSGLSARQDLTACEVLSRFEKFAAANPKDYDREQLAIAYHNCGIQHFEQKKWNSAESYLQRTKGISPKNPTISKSLAAVLASRAHEYFEANELEKARRDYEKALRYDPGNAAAKISLSQVLYRLQSRTDRVQALMSDGAEHYGDSKWNQVADRHRQEVEIEKRTREVRSGQWILRYPANQTGIDPQNIFKLLKEIAQKTGRDFRYWVRHPVVVVLTDENSFRRIHNGPEWAGALNDGRIKVPAGGIFEEPLNFKKVLAHEFTHSISHNLAHGNSIPFWFHEGMAGYEERKIAGLDPHAMEGYQMLPKAVQNQALIPLERLSARDAAGSLHPMEVSLAYEQSLTFVIFLEKFYGFHSLLSFLKEMGKGNPLDASLRTGIGRDLPFLEKQWLDWLRKIEFPVAS